MSGDVNESASEALQQLAEWVVRDDVNSGRLEEYMRELLSERLIELHAVCRFKAIELAHSGLELKSADIASRLCQVAHELQRQKVAVGKLPEHEFSPTQAETGPTTYRLEFNPRQRDPAGERRRLSWLPECIAALAFTTISICLMRGNSGDLWLRALACGTCAVIGICHGGVAIYSLWQNARHNKGVLGKRGSAGA